MKYKYYTSYGNLTDIEIINFKHFTKLITSKALTNIEKHEIEATKAENNKRLQAFYRNIRLAILYNTHE